MCHIRTILIHSFTHKIKFVYKQEGIDHGTYMNSKRKLIAVDFGIWSYL